AIGIPPLSYQWQLNGTPITGATSVNYTNNNPGLADAGNYTVVVTNLYGSTVSDIAVVGVVQSPPSIINNLPSTTNNVYAGFVQQLTATASGSRPFSYQWQLNGAPIAGATNSSLTIGNQTLGMSGYSVVIQNGFGMVNSSTNYV